MTAPDPSALLDVLTTRRRAMLELLDRVVAIESPTDEPERQDPVLDLVGSELAQLGFRPRAVRGETTGDHLFARPAPDRRRGGAQLVVGHVDTVWPVGTLQDRPPEVRDGEYHGPGSFDMKAGLVQLVGALGALHQLGWSPPVDVVVFVNSDEEIGSPDSRRWIHPLARCASRAFVLEGAFGLDGAIKVGRKGVGRYRIRATGRAAHAGLDPEAGASAILELTHQIQRLFALNDPASGVTVNVGTIDGGLRPNVIAPEATAEVDVRVFTVDQANAVDGAIRSLEPVDPDVTIDVTGGFGRPPMERTSATDSLATRAQEIGAELGLAIDTAVVGGASDGNLTSQHTPTLDGLGAVGDGAHRVDEHVLIDTVPQRAALLALLLMEPVPDADPGATS